MTERKREIIDVKKVKEAGLLGEENGATQEINLGYTKFKF